MLLSLFLAFLIRRMLHGKACVLLVFVSLVLVSFLSAGVPTYEVIPSVVTQSGVVFDDVYMFKITRTNAIPAPLSYPVYASLEVVIRGISFGAAQYYRIYFLTTMVYSKAVQSKSEIYTFLFMSWSDYALIYSFFLIINIVGAVIGYWLSRTKFIDKLFTKRKPTERMELAS